ncbi:cAMP-binding domain of CRP or a regulatory subunit of cAMP-dependent protein kinases [Aquimarina amphilecti]|uniref:cAMP-binding domain of CRP or a regulatory subunit of cAMP-dependent protein kinases n=1 Tax=Aquimarina amphilecti TaxID=1038014 RepID=A0A1H7MA29_AQUAM|nr:response regulator [Aquimarina amphilecti]SEL07595.1 cAMP-binding domain of CRP or a regulatory subunit of cAMP-dependent protein kinases [Aquimarina amphilecti]
MKTILLIEDDTALRENTAELLELSDYNVITSPNGKIGITKAKEEKPDIIVCDIMMPEIDGYGVLEALSRDTITDQIPFIFLSAKTEHKEIRKGMDLGADDYLTKPFDEDDLLSAIESRLAKAHIISKRLKEQPQKPEEDSGDGLRSLHELKNFFDDHGDISSHTKGDAIFKEGDHSNKIYLILKGVVKTHKMDESGKELITALFKEDDFLGFTSFTDHTPYQESATAVEDAELAGVSKTDLKDILEKSKNISLELMELLSDNLSEIKEQLLQMAYSSVRKKTAQTILQFTQVLNKKPEESIKISRNDLASVAGIATESLIRTLSSFKKDGLIEIEGRNIKILDLPKLQLIE